MAIAVASALAGRPVFRDLAPSDDEALVADGDDAFIWLLWVPC